MTMQVQQRADVGIQLPGSDLPAGCRRGLCQLFDSLCAQSIRDYTPPFVFPGWPDEVGRTQWFTTPDLVSLRGAPVWDRLDPQQQQLVSFWDAVNFFSANIHGESWLMQGISARLYKPAHDDASPYLHHMLDEENKHSIYFSEFCLRYAGKIYPNRMLGMGTDPAEAADLLFFTRVMIFEDVVDSFNRLMAQDQQLNPTARWIHDNHHREERRHLAFGRVKVRDLFAEGARAWPESLLEAVRVAIAAYLRALWVPMYNPAVYLDAGVDDPYRAATEAHQSQYARDLRARLSRRSVGFLLKNNILLERPQL